MVQACSGRQGRHTWKGTDYSVCYSIASECGVKVEIDQDRSVSLDDLTAIECWREGCRSCGESADQFCAPGNDISRKAQGNSSFCRRISLQG